MRQVICKCDTIDCPSLAQGLCCPGCSAPETTGELPQISAGSCGHFHSITGEYEVIKRLLPGYTGGPPQEGYMLDICKSCLMALPERPYNANRYRQKSYRVQ
jgi:hypothetical protein